MRKIFDLIVLILYSFYLWSLTTRARFCVLTIFVISLPLHRNPPKTSLQTFPPLQIHGKKSQGFSHIKIFNSYKKSTKRTPTKDSEYFTIHFIRFFPPPTNHPQLRNDEINLVSNVFFPASPQTANAWTIEINFPSTNSYQFERFLVLCCLVNESNLRANWNGTSNNDIWDRAGVSSQILAILQSITESDVVRKRNQIMRVSWQSVEVNNMVLQRLTDTSTELWMTFCGHERRERKKMKKKGWTIDLISLEFKWEKRWNEV